LDLSEGRAQGSVVLQYPMYDPILRNVDWGNGDERLHMIDPLLASWLYQITKPVNQKGDRLLRNPIDITGLQEVPNDDYFVRAMLPIKAIGERLCSRQTPDGYEAEVVSQMAIKFETSFGDEILFWGDIRRIMASLANHPDSKLKDNIEDKYSFAGALRAIRHIVAHDPTLSAEFIKQVHQASVTFFTQGNASYLFHLGTVLDDAWTSTSKQWKKKVRTLLPF